MDWKPHRVGNGADAMSLRALKWFTVLLPPFIIGSFEYIRHSEWMLRHLSMERGNLFIALLSLAVSFAVSSFLFRRIERSNRRLAEERAARAVLEERERLAGELHDRIAQMLFYLNVSLKDGKVEDARSVAAEIDGHLRQAIFNLRQPPERDGSFPAQVARWIGEWRLLAGVETAVSVDVPADYFDDREQIALMGIIQEAFTNIRKHAEAVRVFFALRADDRGWEMRIRDDGKGHDPLEAARMLEADGPAAARMPEGRGKYGMSIMRKRARELGADMAVNTRPGAGWELVLTGTRNGG